MGVLVIDDDPFALMLLATQLGALGVDAVETCDSAQAALTMLDHAAAKYDALFVDLNMPGMDGVEFLRHLAKERYRGGLVLVSGEDERILQSVAALAKAHRLRVLGSLHKPVSAQQLEGMLAGLPLEPRTTLIGTVRKRYSAEELRDAIACAQLVNHYQPKVELDTGEVSGVETLVRWRHPNDGLVYPDQFVPLAEANRLSDELARVVMAGALRDARRWREGGLDLRLSVNVSIDNLVALSFPDDVVSGAAAAGIPVDRIVLEVTESQLVSDRVTLLDIVTRLRLKHIGLSIDDFGTGYSSQAQLRDIPFNEMKLDRSFVHGAAGNDSLRAILQANIGMARTLGLLTVAEGVEDRSDWDCLRALGCDLAQGYFIAKPMPAAALTGWLAEWNGRRGELFA